MRSEVLHAALECEAKVGGVGAVTMGLTSALANKDYNVSIVTPGYDVYFNKHFKDKNIELLTTVNHIYKGEVHESNVFRVVKEVDGQIINHYLIRPKPNSSVAKLFDIQDQLNIYQSFPWSESRNRLEYLNSAIAAMLRFPNDKLPEFNLYHGHTWHTGIAGVLAKEMKNMPAWRALYGFDDSKLKRIPYVVSTIHMLLEREHGDLHNAKDIKEFLASIGLPADFSSKFQTWKHYVSPKHLKKIVLSAIYADAVTMVSEGLKDETITGNGHGVDDLFKWLNSQGRLHGILNGIVHAKYDGTCSENLGVHALQPGSLVESKLKIKQCLAEKFPHLDPNKMWFGFIARFAAEKGMDMLKTALDAITKEDGVFIVMGSHVVTKKLPNGQIVNAYQELIDELRKHPNVLVIDDSEVQKIYGNAIRGSLDSTLMLSHNEACGLPQIENFAYGAAAIGPKIQGIPDSIKDLITNPTTGSGFLYSDDPKTRNANLATAIHNYANFYRQQHAAGTMNKFLDRILQYSKQFDWNGNSASKYNSLYQSLFKRPLISPNRCANSTNETCAHTKLHCPPPLTFTGNKPSVKTGSATKIFQIGFNKCGTQSLYTGFKDNRIACIHYGLKNKTLASIIYSNINDDKPLLEGVDQFCGYFDMEDIYHSPPLFVGKDYFKLLDKQYPGSKFIFNTRDKERWIQSRLSHVDVMKNLNYVDVMCEQYQCTKEELIHRWSMEWDEHHQAVRKYFKDRPNDFLEYHIENDDPSKIAAFFPDLKLDQSKFSMVNKTTRPSK